MNELPIHYSEVESIYGCTLGAGYRTLAITSAAPSEGKTMIAEALVKRAEAAGKKVLLVEMNTFNPALKRKLDKQIRTEQLNFEQTSGYEPQKGSVDSDNPKPQITSLTGGSACVLSVLSDVSVITKYRELSLLQGAINEWLSTFDCVVFDTAALAMLNQHNIPAESVCQACEGTVIVAAAGQTPANLIEEGINKLVARQVNIIGTVMNDYSNPSLLSELIRETKKLDRFMPKLMTKLRAKLSQMVILKVST
jgi:Mrp family chromosome partitioning ATPase